MKAPWQVYLGRFSFVAGLCFLALSAYLLQAYVSQRATLMDTARNLAEQEGRKAAEKANLKLLGISDLVTRTARDLSEGRLPLDALSGRLKRLVLAESDLHEVGAAFEPYSYDPELRLYGIAYRADNVENGIELDARFDYTLPEVSWYATPLSDGPTWFEPKRDETSQSMLMTYAAPFYQPDPATGNTVKTGVLYATLSLEVLKNTIRQLNLGEEGYAYILSPKGQYLMHPNREYVDGETTIFDVAEKEHSRALKEMGEAVIRGESGSAALTDDITGLPSWVFFSPIEAPGWSLGVVMPRGYKLLPPIERRRKLIDLGLFFLGALVLLAVPLTGVSTGSHANLWRYSLRFVPLCILGMVYILGVHRFTMDLRDATHQRVTNQSAVQRFISQRNRAALDLGGLLPIYVPTGLYVQTLTFRSANEVQITGHIWQKYSDGIHDNLVRGFVMPQSEALEIEEPTVERQGNVELWSWRFNVTLHQEFDYTKYPFGGESISIQLWHKQFYQNVVLVPDFDSYSLTTPSARPGLLEDVALPGWEILETFFSYRERASNTNFGLGNYVSLAKFPDLHYNILIRKRMVAPIISHLFPIVVPFVIVYTILLLTTRQQKPMDLFGFKPMTVVAACGGPIFLVVLFSHIDLRDKLAIEGLIYIDYFYFMTYLAILGVAINATLLTRIESRWVLWRDNLIPQILFMPVSQGIMLLITLWIFY